MRVRALARAWLLMEERLRGGEGNVKGLAESPGAAVDTRIDTYIYINLN